MSACALCLSSHFVPALKSSRKYVRKFFCSCWQFSSSFWPLKTLRAYTVLPFERFFLPALIPSPSRYRVGLVIVLCLCVYYPLFFSVVFVAVGSVSCSRLSFVLCPPSSPPARVTRVWTAELLLSLLLEYTILPGIIAVERGELFVTSELHQDILHTDSPQG